MTNIQMIRKLATAMVGEVPGSDAEDTAAFELWEFVTGTAPTERLLDILIERGAILTKF